MRHVLPRMPFATSVDAASDALAFMALDPPLEGVGGRFYGEKHAIESSPESYERDRARQFWDLAATLAGVTAL